MNTSQWPSAARRGWQRSRRLLGTPGLAGCALLVVGVLLGVAGPTVRHDADEARVALEHRRELLRRTLARAPRPLTPQQRLAHYVEGFPTLTQNASDVRTVFADAERRHVALPKGEYTMKADAGSPFVTYTATFAVHESYLALKAFVGDVLQSVPNAALDELRMARPDSTGRVLDATVRFTFVYRRA